MLLVLSAAAAAVSHAAQVNPLEQVISLMDELAAKIAKEGESEVKAYGEFVEWCDDMASSGRQAIATYTAKKGKLEAKISELSEEAESCSSKIEDLAASISANERDLTDATAIFNRETADFKESESALAQDVDTLSRAVSVLEREMAKNPAAFAQMDTSSIQNLLRALSTVMDAAAFNIADKQQLTALVQSQDEDEELGAPKVANYKSQSGSIVDVLEDLKEKAETKLDTVRKEYVQTKHNYNMMESSLESQIGADKKGLAEEKSQKAQAEESKATAETDLAAAVKNLAESKDNMANGNSMCMQTAADHDASLADRTEELKVIAQAKKIVTESTGGAAYLFLQFSNGGLRTHEDLVGVEVVTAVKRLAKQQHSSALTQLASKISAVLQYGAGAGADPFAKVKGLLEAMITKLEKEAGEASEEKAYCDEQLSKTEAKKSELEDDKDKLTVKIDSA
jgi:chromosome segregation ATPase